MATSASTSTPLHSSDASLGDDVRLPHYSWQFIWTFFMRAPRVRAWLFQRSPPPLQQTVQALLSEPLLVGYIFGDLNNRPRYSFPDIGDLHCVFCRDGDALLGFHFGFQGVQPVLPMLFQISKDPLLGNPNVVVRRTVKQLAPFPGANCYLSLEFNWFESGALAVCSNIHPISPSPTDSTTTSSTPAYLNHIEFRVFSRATAERLADIEQRHSLDIDLAFFPHPTHFKDLPPDFLHPPDDCYVLTIHEPDHHPYRAALTAAHARHHANPHRQKFELEKDFPLAHALHDPPVTPDPNTTPASARSKRPRPAAHATAGTPLHSSRDDVTSVAEEKTVALWAGYQQHTTRSRRNGVFNSMVFKKIGSPASKPIPLYGRESTYTFLSTTGVNARGRIQRLCMQLGILSSSPLPDQVFAHMQQQNQPEDNNALTNSRSHASTITAAATDRRGFPPTDRPGWDPLAVTPQPPSDPWRSNVAAQAGLLMTPNELSFAPSSVTASLATAAASVSSRATLETTDLPLPKRQRYAPPAPVTPQLPGHARHPPPSQQQQQQHQPSDSSSLPAESYVEPQGLWRHDSAVEPVAFVPELTPRQGQTQAQDAAQHVRRRSFDITDILSDDNYYLSNGKNSSRNALSSATNVLTASSEVKSTAMEEAESIVPPTLDGEEAETVSVEPQSTNNSAAGASAAKDKSRPVWTCDRCGVTIRGKKGNLNRHIANKHDNIRAFQCTEPNCGRKFQTRLNLVRHTTAVHKGRPFTCTKCPRAFKYENDLNMHVRSAHEEACTKLECQVCKSCFGRRSTLNRHMVKVHKINLDNS